MTFGAVDIIFIRC